MVEGERSGLPRTIEEIKRDVEIEYNSSGREKLPTVAPDEVLQALEAYGRVGKRAVTIFNAAIKENTARILPSNYGGIYVDVVVGEANFTEEPMVVTIRKEEDDENAFLIEGFDDEELAAYRNEHRQDRESNRPSFLIDVSGVDMEDWSGISLGFQYLNGFDVMNKNEMTKLAEITMFARGLHELFTTQ